MHLPDLAGEPDDDLAKKLTDLVQRIWKAKGVKPGTINRDVTTAFAGELWKGTMQGYGNDLISIDYDTPDFRKLAALQKNVWQFSAAKNYTQLRQLTNALLDDEGNLRTFEQFKEAAFKINSDHTVRFLKAEYELAVGGAQMAGKWVEIQANKNILPLLQFDAVVDSQTTDLCKSLDGTTLPVDHPFWKRYYPKNHWGCRSTVRQLASGAVTPENKIPTADIPDMFKTNLGQQGLLFPPKHPYNIDQPDYVQKQGIAAMRKSSLEIAKRLQGKSVQVQGVGEVHFVKRGIEKMISQPHADYIFKNQLVAVSDQMLKNVELIKTATDTKGRGYVYQYLRVKGLPENIVLVVRELEDGRKVLYSIVDSVK